jgi:hypothetical protein
MDKFCIERTAEMCAIKIQLSTHVIYIVAVYRAPSGIFSQFLLNLDDALRMTFNAKVKIIVCGDININYIKESLMKEQLEDILSSYNLVSVVDFPTRSHNCCESLIDNVFIDRSQFKNYSVHPFVNGLSDHDGQLLIIKSMGKQHYNQPRIMRRNINSYSMSEFKINLSYEVWEDTFNSEDVDIGFNTFLNTYLRIFYASFPLKKITTDNFRNNNWITTGIKVSCQHKRELFLQCRNLEGNNFKKFYKVYCRILTEVIKAAKKLNYDRLITNSRNEMKTAWKIVNTTTGKKPDNRLLQFIDAYNSETPTDNRSDIADVFQNYFLSVADKIRSNINRNDTPDKSGMDYLFKAFKKPFPKLVLKRTSTKEIAKIIKDLKPKHSSGYDEVPLKILIPPPRKPYLLY